MRTPLKKEGAKKEESCQGLNHALTHLLVMVVNSGWWHVTGTDRGAVPRHGINTGSAGIYEK